MKSSFLHPKVCVFYTHSTSAFGSAAWQGLSRQTWPELLYGATQFCKIWRAGSVCMHVCIFGVVFKRSFANIVTKYLGSRMY